MPPGNADAAACEVNVATIVVAEDERDLNALVRRHLEDEGHRVVQVYDGPDAVAAVQRERPDLLILDWMLPKFDGLEVCRRVRRDSIVPILMLTARSEEIDRVLGLEVGADDYLTKPFGVRELLARVKAMLRRVELFREAANTDQPPILTAGTLVVDLGQHTVTADGRPVDLTPKEFDLLALLVKNPGRAFARDYLLERVWGYEYGGFDRTVDTHVLRLRKKLGPSGDQIETVWGVGYRLSARPRGTP
jgi:DNA-binding response OmpR family regulator